jgi:NADH dehydrogenase
MVMEILDMISLGLLPNDFKLTRDQVTLLQRDNVVSEAAIREGRTLEGLGIAPTSFEAVVPAYLVRFRKTGQFDLDRNTAFAAPPPDTVAPQSAGPGSQFQPTSPPGPTVR